MSNGGEWTYIGLMVSVMLGESYTISYYGILDLPGNARRDLREHGDNSQKDCDGFIFSKIRHYQDQDDEEQVARWLTKWSGNPSKVRDFHQLQTSETARGLKLALDKNLCYGGLWKDFKMGTFHRILSMRCHEVGNMVGHSNYRYLTSIGVRMLSSSQRGYLAFDCK